MGEGGEKASEEEETETVNECMRGVVKEQGIGG